MLEGPVADLPVLGTTGQLHMHLDWGIMEEVIEDLPHLLHVDGEMDVIRSNFFRLLLKWNEGVLGNWDMVDHLFII